MLLVQKAAPVSAVALALLPRPKALVLEHRLHRTLRRTRPHLLQLCPRLMLLEYFTSLKPCFSSW